MKARHPDGESGAPLDRAVTPRRDADPPVRVRAVPENVPVPPRPHMPVVTVPPRLLDLESSARYLGVSPWTVRDLVANGTLVRVRIPLPGGDDLRKVLLDREELDRLVARWKA